MISRVSALEVQCDDCGLVIQLKNVTRVWARRRLRKHDWMLSELRTYCPACAEKRKAKP